MPRILVFVLVLINCGAFDSARAQQELKRRSGPFRIYGPVRTMRAERATFTRENGQLVEGPRLLVMTWTYNEDGTRQEVTLYGPDGAMHRTVNTYDPDGRILETNNFLGTDVLNNRVVSTYDDHKQLIERVTYGRDGLVLNRTVFHRQGSQHENETWVYDSKGVIIAQSKTTNDLPAKRANSISINRAGVVQTEASTIDNPDGSREFRQEQSNGNFKREVMKPDVKGGEERVIYNRDGTIQSRERLVREFDSYHNLIKTTRLVAKGDAQDFEPVDVTYRIITYYGKD